MGKSRRLELSAILHEVLGSDHVYFQPGEDLTIEYPAIVYERDKASAKHADNIPYLVAQGYQVTYLDKKPDSDVIDKLLALPSSSHDRHFATSGLNHDVFTIFH